jgi:hypothetical protein
LRISGLREISSAVSAIILRIAFDDEMGAISCGASRRLFGSL